MLHGLQHLAAHRDELAARAERLADERNEIERALQAADDEKAKLADKLAAKTGPQRDTLVQIALADNVTLFYWDGEVYACVPVGDHVETVKVRARAFRRWLNVQYYARYNRNAGGEGLNDALLAIEGAAFDRGEECRPHVRLAEYDGRIFLDLGEPGWQVIEVGPQGWRAVAAANVPVRFIRPRGLRPFPFQERADGSNTSNATSTWNRKTCRWSMLG